MATAERKPNDCDKNVDRSLDSSDGEVGDWETISLDDCTLLEGKEAAMRVKRQSLLSRWHAVVRVVGARSGRGRGVLEKSELWLKSATENEDLIDVLRRGKQSGKLSIESLRKSEENAEILDRGREIIDSLKLKEDVQQTVSILEDFQHEESYLKLLEEGKKLFEDEDATLTSRDQLEKAQVILRQLEQSETFKRLKSHVETTAVKYCDEETIKQGKQVVKNVKTSEEFKQLVTEGKKVVSRFATGEEQDLSASVSGLVQLGGQVVQHAKASDAGAALVEKGSKVVENLTEAWKANKMQSQAAEILKQNEEFVEDVKNVVLPWARDQLLSLQLPVVTGSKMTKMGNVNYELSDMQLSSLAIPVDKVTMWWDMDCLHVDITGLHAAMKNFTWQYNKMSFPWLKDDGKADTSIGGGSFHVTIEIKASVTITELSAHFDSFQLETRQTRASWLYNTLIYWFKDGLQTTLNEQLNLMLDLHAASLSDAINKVVRQHLPKLAAKLITGGEKDGNETQEEKEEGEGFDKKD